MTHRSPPLPSSPCSEWEEKSFSYSIESLHSCCAEARDAASSGRYSAAHDLFQNALVFFDRACGVKWNDSDELYLWQHTWQLSQARRELDGCAELIYTDQVALESRPWPVLKGEKSA